MMDVIKKTLVFLALFLSRKKICKCQLRKIQVASFLISLSLFFNCVIFFLFSARVTRTPCHWARALRARLCLSFFQWEGTFLRKNGSIFCNTFFFMSFFCWISEILKFFCSFFLQCCSALNNLWWATLFFQVKFVRILKISREKSGIMWETEKKEKY